MAEQRSAMVDTREVPDCVPHGGWHQSERGMRPNRWSRKDNWTSSGLWHRADASSGAWPASSWHNIAARSELTTDDRRLWAGWDSNNGDRDKESKSSDAWRRDASGYGSGWWYGRDDQTIAGFPHLHQQRQHSSTHGDGSAGSASGSHNDASGWDGNACKIDSSGSVSSTVVNCQETAFSSWQSAAERWRTADDAPFEATGQKRCSSVPPANAGIKADESKESKESGSRWDSSSSISFQYAWKHSPTSSQDKELAKWPRTPSTQKYRMPYSRCEDAGASLSKSRWWREAWNHEDRSSTNWHFYHNRSAESNPSCSISRPWCQDEKNDPFAPKPSCSSSAGSARTRSHSSIPHCSRASPHTDFTCHDDKEGADQGDVVGKDQSHAFAVKYALGDFLATGLKGKIYLAQERKSGRQFAVKKPKDAWDTSDFDLLSQKQHPNIIQVVECFRGDDETFIVMEWCSGGDLFQALGAFGMPPAWSWSAKVFEQILCGLKYLHSVHGESHNDIKPENLLLDRCASNLQYVPRVMLADFGCAAIAGSLTQKTGGGDPRYRAPETFWGAPFGFSTDVWACGVVLYEILSAGRLIFTGERNIHGFREFRKYRDGSVCFEYMRALASGRPVDVSGFSGVEAQTLLASLLAIEPQERMTVDIAITDQWIMNGTAGKESKSLEEDSLLKPDTSQPMPPGSPSKKWGGC